MAVCLDRYWGIPVEEASHSLAGNAFMLGVGAIAAVILSAYFGRLPVFSWFTVANLLSAIWCAAAKDFEAFEAGRIVNGFFSTVAQAVSSSASFIWSKSHNAVGRPHVDPRSLLPSSTCAENQHLDFGARHIAVPWTLTRRVHGQLRSLAVGPIGYSPSKLARS